MALTRTSTLFVAWQNPDSRLIVPVGRLRDLGERGYEFAYVNAAQKAQGFIPFVAFPDLEQVYRSVALPGLFKNRVMPSSRPDYPAFVRQLGLTPEDAPPMDVLARSGGRRTTDELEVFAPPLPTPDTEYAVMPVLVRGVRHIPHAEEAIAGLEEGETLFVARDEQNELGEHPLLLRTAKKQLVGYLPDYLSSEFGQHDFDIRSALHVSVSLVNPPPDPVHHRLLCEVRSPRARKCFAGEEYEPISSAASRTAA